MGKFLDRAAGLGFVIPEGYFFLDIDHRPKENALVQTMLRRFDSCAEYSVSGSGIHIYGKCDPSQPSHAVMLLLANREAQPFNISPLLHFPTYPWRSSSQNILELGAQLIRCI